MIHNTHNLLPSGEIPHHDQEKLSQPFQPRTAKLHYTITIITTKYKPQFILERPSRGCTGCYLFTVSNSGLLSVQGHPITDTASVTDTFLNSSRVSIV